MFKIWSLSTFLLIACIPTAKAAEPVPPPELEPFTRQDLPQNAIWLEDLDLSNMIASEGTTVGSKAINGELMTMKGVVYPRGVGTRAPTELNIALDGSATRFETLVGIDDRGRHGGVLRFEIWVDGKKKAESGPMTFGDTPVPLAVDLKNAKRMQLLVSNDVFEMEKFDNANWAHALFVLKPGTKAKPRTTPVAHPPAPKIVTSRSDMPAIHGPRKVGATPGRPFLFLIPATGKGPLTFIAEALPAGLSLNADTGIITGTLKNAGASVVKITAQNAVGKATRDLTIVAGPNKLALTPPMGWNSWNVWGTAIDADKVRAAADAMVASGLAAHGFQYINIDDAWEGKRDAKGNIQTNEKFPDIKALADYVHSKGLKLGIYSSPGPLTCAKYEGSYKHESQDALTFAKWGIDYLKHDWCSYGEIVKDTKDLQALQKPYRIMSAGLEASGRDIVLSMCQYGLGNVSTWGKSVGGHLWRTTGDILDTWPSMASIGFGHAERAQHAQPGGWNDPDMLVVGKVGWGPSLHPSRLAPHEQLTHITLWSLLAAPLLIGCDMTQLDPYTLALLTNDEVLDVDQDPLGKAAARVDTSEPKSNDVTQVWARPLHDGTMAVGLFNTGTTPTKVTATWQMLGLKGKQPVRDLWLHKSLGSKENAISATVAKHSVLFVKVGKPAGQTQN